jgi:Putative Zn-dependent protease, contains TPR repeats
MSPRAFLFLFFATLAPAASLDLAREHYEAKRYDDARAAFTELASASPPNPELHYHLGLVAMKTGDTDEAIRCFELATQLAPENSDYHMELGGAYGAKAEKVGLLSKMTWAKKCQAALEKSVALNPDNLTARNGLVSYYRTAPTFVGGGLPKAYEQAEEIRRRDLVMGTAILAQLYIREKKFDAAIATLADATQSHPENYHLHYLIGRTAADSGTHLDAGQEALRRCLELTPGPHDPSHAHAHWRLGLIAQKRGDTPAARAAFEKSLSLDPTLPEPRTALASLPSP